MTTMSHDQFDDTFDELRNRPSGSHTPAENEQLLLPFPQSTVRFPSSGDWMAAAPDRSDGFDCDYGAVVDRLRHDTANDAANRTPARRTPSQEPPGPRGNVIFLHGVAYDPRRIPAHPPRRFTGQALSAAAARRVTRPAPDDPPRRGAVLTAPQRTVRSLSAIIENAVADAPGASDRTVAPPAG
ncbi:hypothetical protein L1787_03415 [Acuticoccus sp. M5D2P5]|uniref:hypothetical protein n=1 Tax=Acuticoccus kalidii TaxID=2910977 RepID=UPI001F2F2FB6|nr:hypothetical protein [Acuticoccus kalidii]MCF3932463.1 hypothetical protein [Acuticoccus kalidii]